MADSDFEIIVVGGGIAGLTAGLTAARLGRKTLVLTGDTLGGHLLNIDRIDGYPGFPEGVPGFDLCPMAQEQAADAGADVQMVSASSLESADNAWRIETPAGRFTAPSVVLATGTRLKALGIDGESMLRGKGVSQCASCDAPLLAGKPAVVAGGGDSALQEALTLADHCSQVTIVHHGPEYSAQSSYRDAVEGNPKITALTESEIGEILGQDAVEGVRVRKLPGGDTTEIDCAGVFVFVGLTPETSLVSDASILADSGHIVTDASMRTGFEGLFAAGTVRAGHAGRAAAAAGDGALAAITADAYLNDGGWVDWQHGRAL